MKLTYSFLVSLWEKEFIYSQRKYPTFALTGSYVLTCSNAVLMPKAKRQRERKKTVKLNRE